MKYVWIGGVAFAAMMTAAAFLPAKESVAPSFTPPAAAEDAKVIDLSWEMLAPPRENVGGTLEERLALLGRTDLGAPASRLGGVVAHGVDPMASMAANAGTELVEELNGETVRIPGYAVPLDFEEDGSRIFLLVPFIGACIHVPPPPPNQLIVVTTEKPVKFNDMFDAIVITGELSTAPLNTELAEVGYQMTLSDIQWIPDEEAWGGPDWGESETGVGPTIIP